MPANPIVVLFGTRTLVALLGLMCSHYNRHRDQANEQFSAEIVAFFDTACVVYDVVKVFNQPGPL